MFEKLDDQKFVNRLFTHEDRLDLKYVEEARRRAKSVVPLFCEILLQEKNYKRRGKAWWGVIHATFLLGILAEESAFDALLSSGKFSDVYDIDWIWEALPECYFRLGPAVIPRLKGHIAGHKLGEYDHVTFQIEGLWNFWEAFPNERQGIEEFLLTVLKTCKNDPALNANLIADFSQIGRLDLKPFFIEMFDRGEVDLEVLTRDDMEHFFEKMDRAPGFRKDLEKFYSREEIEKRQKRWKEEDERAERRVFENYLLENYKQIGRNDKCPCGSGKKYKKCHLPWVEDELIRMRDEEESEDILWENIGAIKAERRAESELRKFLTSKQQTELFPIIKGKVLELVKAQDEEFRAKGFSGYFQEIFSLLKFDKKEEAEHFMNALQEYLNAVAHQYQGHPRNDQMPH